MPQAATQTDQATLDLESLTADVVALAMKAGASDAEAVVREGDEFSVNVRMGEVETLKESGSRNLGLRVFLGTRSASTSRISGTTPISDRMSKNSPERSLPTSIRILSRCLRPGPRTTTRAPMREKYRRKDSSVFIQLPLL